MHYHIIIYNKLITTTKMEDLLPPQIKDSCKLALPDGLKELMSDISREILRHQPRDLYKFIADYLAAMLITRDNLTIAGYICNDISQCSCEPELRTELRDIGVPEDDIETARDIIVNYLEKSPVQESTLLVKLLKKTNIDENMMPAVQDAIRNAYIRHQAQNTTIYESSSGSEQDEMMCAARHTLEIYRKTAPSEETYEIMAEKIQTSYRAYGVRRDCNSKDTAWNADHTKSADPKVFPQRSSSGDIFFPKTTYSEETISLHSWAEDQDINITSSMNKKRITTMSSTSLAGSLLNLPSYKPYSAHDCDSLSNLGEYPEREHAHIDYTVDNPHFSLVTEDKLFYKREKKISFSETVTEETKKMGIEVDNDSESKDSNQNESSMEADADMFYHGDEMTIESNYDGDAEMEQSDITGENDDNDAELLNEVPLDT